MKSLLQRDALQAAKNRLGALRPDCDARWGRMSAHQAACHLADAFRLVLGERPTDMRGSLLTTTVIRFRCVDPTCCMAEERPDGSRG